MYRTVTIICVYCVKNHKSTQKTKYGAETVIIILLQKKVMIWLFNPNVIFQETFFLCTV
jgi:hypothetical protein